jgi:hypothetical protein
VQISYHPAAAIEVVKDVRYYNAQSPGLGTAFKDKVDHAVQRIAARPERFAPGSNGTRRCPLDRFPHRIVYRVESDVIRIYAIAHPKRSPSYWAERLK